MMEQYKKLKSVVWGKDFKTWDAFVAALKSILEENAKMYQERMTAYNELMALAEKCYGKATREYKYLAKNPPERPNRPRQSTINKQKRNYNLYLKAEREKEYRKEYPQRVAVAVADLIAMGYVLDEDFTANHAISFKKRVERNESIQEEAQDSAADAKEAQGANTP